MTLRAPLIVVTSLSFGLIGGCGGEGAPYERVVDAQTNFGENLCECAGAFEISEADCLDSFVPDELTQSEQACIDAVIADNRAQFKPLADCAVDAYREANSCVNSIRACDEEEVLACFTDLAGDLDDCPEVSESLTEDLDACTD